MCLAFQVAPNGWTPRSFLEIVARATPRFSAIIDTGALITGLSNKQVAAYLLNHGLGEWCEGVVFLDESDQKVILVKETGRVLKLAQCGIDKSKRFAFYDQIHTTGIDIQHALNARAAITLGKDMVFRDFAQGAYRMRQIGKGQTLVVFATPEVEELKVRQLAKCQDPFAVVAGGGGGGDSGEEGATRALAQRRLREISAWLNINAMRTERTQFDQLCAQNLANVWRQNAFSQLMGGCDRFKVRTDEISAYVWDALGEAFLSTKRGGVAKAALEGKMLALVFDDKPHGRGELFDGLKVMAEKFEHGLEVIWIPTLSHSDDYFADVMKRVPFLVVPNAHVQRRELLIQLFDVATHAASGATSEPTVVLLDADHRTITKDAAELIRIAHGFASIDTMKEQEVKSFKELMTARDKEKTKLAAASKGLEPLETTFAEAAAVVNALEPRDVHEVGSR